MGAKQIDRLGLVEASGEGKPKRAVIKGRDKGGSETTQRKETN